MKRILFIGIATAAILASAIARAQSVFEFLDPPQGTNISVVTTNRNPATNLTWAVPLGHVVGLIEIESASNSTSRIVIWWGTNSLLQGGITLNPGDRLIATPSPRINTNWFGALLDNGGTAYIGLTRSLAKP